MRATLSAVGLILDELSASLPTAPEAVRFVVRLLAALLAGGIAGIWMTAAIGVTIGLGQLGTAAIGTALAWLVLSVLVRVDKRIDGPNDRDG